MGSDTDVRFNEAGLKAIQDSHGWFVVNRGTLAEPHYQLFRLTGQSVRPGQYIPDLSLLGPTSIPEVSERDLTNPQDSISISSKRVSESEMNPFYRMPDHPAFDVPPEYRERLFARLQALKGTLLTQGATDQPSLEDVKKVIFDKIDFHDQNMETTQGGKRCTRVVYATARIHGSAEPGALVMDFYPPAKSLSPEWQEWLVGHEVGHGLSFIMNFEQHFNELPSWKRATILLQLEHFQEYLAKVGKPVNGVSTGTEATADALSYFLRDPVLLRTRAPAVYAFIAGEIEREPILKRLIRIPQPVS